MTDTHLKIIATAKRQKELDGPWVMIVLTRYDDLWEYAAYQGKPGYDAQQTVKEGKKVLEKYARVMFGDIIQPEDKYRA